MGKLFSLFACLTLFVCNAAERTPIDIINDTSYMMTAQKMGPKMAKDEGRTPSETLMKELRHEHSFKFQAPPPLNKKRTALSTKKSFYRIK